MPGHGLETFKFQGGTLKRPNSRYNVNVSIDDVKESLTKLA